jgi:hypothetical protein
MRFSLCHASARVPDGWVRAAEAWLSACDEPDEVEHILCTKEPMVIANEMVLGYGVQIVTACHDARGAVDQWNQAAKYSHGDILIMMADDLFPPKHWDTKLWNVYLDISIPSDGVFDVGYTPDNPCYPLIAHSIVTRDYYDCFGYLLHPDYIGLMSDVEFTEVARASGRVVPCYDIELRHLNPERGTAPWDDVYKKHRSTLKQDQETYEKRKKAGFPIESVL